MSLAKNTEETIKYNIARHKWLKTTHKHCEEKVSKTVFYKAISVKNLKRIKICMVTINRYDFSVHKKHKVSNKPRLLEISY